MGELMQFLDADSGVPQHLDERPSPKLMLLGPIQQYQLAGVGVASPDIAGKRVRPIDPGEGPSRDGERLPKRVLLTGGEQLLRFASPAVGGFDVGSEVVRGLGIPARGWRPAVCWAPVRRFADGGRNSISRA